MHPAVHAVGDAHGAHAAPVRQAQRPGGQCTAYVKLKVQRPEIRAAQLFGHVGDYALDARGKALKEVDKARTLAGAAAEGAFKILGGKLPRELGEPLAAHGGYSARRRRGGDPLQHVMHKAPGLRGLELRRDARPCPQPIAEEVGKAAVCKTLQL